MSPSSVNASIIGGDLETVNGYLVEWREGPTTCSWRLWQPVILRRCYPSSSAMFFLEQMCTLMSGHLTAAWQQMASHMAQSTILWTLLIRSQVYILRTLRTPGNMPKGSWSGVTVRVRNCLIVFTRIYMEEEVCSWYGILKRCQQHCSGIQGLKPSSWHVHLCRVCILNVYISSSPVFLFLRRFLYNRDSVTDVPRQALSFAHAWKRHVRYLHSNKAKQLC